VSISLNPKIAKFLRESGFGPREKNGTWRWKGFIAGHGKRILACDFFSVETLSLVGERWRMRANTTSHKTPRSVPVSPPRETTLCGTYLLREFTRRKRRNPKYSIRAFARQIGISKTSLSSVMAGDRGISELGARRIAEKLILPSHEVDRMLEEINSRQEITNSSSLLFELSEDFFSLISDWEHYAILNLAKTRQNQSNVSKIGRRLGITPSRARNVIRRLTKMGLIKIVDGELIRTSMALRSTTDLPSRAIKKYHRQQLELAKWSLDHDSIEKRDITAITMAVNPKNLPEAKKLCTKLRRRISKLLEAGPKSEVYTLSIQLFPLTRGEI
jgi:uncharacterized protein (TIGR02147 family)